MPTTGVSNVWTDGVGLLINFVQRDTGWMWLAPAYAKNAFLELPCLSEYEQKIVPFQRAAAG